MTEPIDAREAYVRHLREQADTEGDETRAEHLRNAATHLSTGADEYRQGEVHAKAPPNGG